MRFALRALGTAHCHTFEVRSDACGTIVHIHGSFFTVPFWIA